MNLQKMLQNIPKDRNLFLSAVKKFETNPSDLQNTYCVFVGAYYHDKSYGEKAIDAIQKHALQKDFNIFNAMMIQSHFYIQQAPGSRTRLQLHLNQVGDYVDQRWRALNPFIVPSSTLPEKRKEVFVGIRMTNFDKEGTRYFAAHGGKIKNYYEGQLFSLEDQKCLKVFKFRELTDYPRFTNDWYHVEGLEDYRVASYPLSPLEDGREGEMNYRGFVVSIDAHHEGFPQKQLPRQSLVDISFSSSEYKSKTTTPSEYNKSPISDGGENSNYLEVSNLRPMRGVHVNNLDAQKNWLPFFLPSSKGEKDEGSQCQLYAIYKSDPLIVLKINEENGECEKIVMKNAKGTTFFRGSSPPVPYGENYLYSVHIVGFLPEGKGRIYYHRLVEISLSSNQCQVVRISRMFYLNDKATVEYISGAYNDGEKIHFTYGFDDKEAWIASLTHDEVEKMF